MVNNFKEDIFSGFYNLVPEAKIGQWLKKYSDSLDCAEAYGNFEYRLHKSKRDSQPSSTALARLLADSVRNLESLNPLLLLSSGKDSVALALAFHDCGIQLNCLSLVSDREEADWITWLCKHLGHRVEFVRV